MASQLEEVASSFDAATIDGDGDQRIGEEQLDLVRRLLKARRMRARYFPDDLFGEPAWDMLLDIYLSRAEGRLLSVSDVCIAAEVPFTTALRWVRKLESVGMMVRVNDPVDRRRIFVHLTNRARDAITDWVIAAQRLGL
jgi:hypothetical protein